MLSKVDTTFVISRRLSRVDNQHFTTGSWPLKKARCRNTFGHLNVYSKSPFSDSVFLISSNMYANEKGRNQLNAYYNLNISLNLFHKAVSNAFKKSFNTPFDVQVKA